MINGETRVIGIVADPIGHVRTPERFNAYIEHRSINAVLVPFHVRPDDFAGFIANLPTIRNLVGMVVTIPYKEIVLSCCTGVTDEARRIGAVNVLRIGHEPKTITGTNLDGEGFVQGLIGQGHGVDGRRVFVAGAGGAGKAIAHALAQHGTASIGVYNRTESRALELVEDLRAHYPQIDAHVAGARPENYTLAVNSTSLGLSTGDARPFSLDGLPSSALVAEVVMNRDMTPLLKDAEERGHPIHFGRHMVDAQIDQMARFFGLL